MNINDMTRLLDAQQAEAFLISQITHIEKSVYTVKYPEIRYPGLIPIDTSAAPWTPSVTYFSTDGAGQAAWFAGGAQDMQHADVNYNKFETSVRMAGIGYRYDIEELSQGAMLGRNLTDDKARYARLAAEKFIDQSALFGDTKVGFQGLLNNSTVTTSTAPATGTGSATFWSTKTPDQILSDFNGLLTGVWTGSNTVEMCDTVLLGLTVWSYIATTRLHNLSEKTILDWLLDKNVYTAETGQRLTVKAIRGLDTAGSGSTSRLVAYRRDPTVVKMHLPMPYRFLPTPWHVGPMLWEVPGIFRFGGVDIRRPGAFRYMDGV